MQDFVTLRFVSYETRVLLKELKESIGYDLMYQFGKPHKRLFRIFEAYKFHFMDEERNDIFWTVLGSKGHLSYYGLKYPGEF